VEAAIQLLEELRSCVGGVIAQFDLRRLTLAAQVVYFK
jgi:hypothetical protein